jgi:hypothetical protein
MPLETIKAPMARTFRMRHATWLLFGLVSAVLGGLVFFFLLPIFVAPLYWNTAPFSRQLWLENPSVGPGDNLRGRMVADIRRRHLRPGMRREEIVRMLGKPDNVHSRSELSHYPELKGADLGYSYRLGLCKSMDDWSLDIGFDRSGCLVATGLTQY